METETKKKDQEIMQEKTPENGDGKPQEEPIKVIMRPPMSLGALRRAIEREKRKMHRTKRKRRNKIARASRKRNRRK